MCTQRRLRPARAFALNGKLIPVFLGTKFIVFVLSCCGSHDKVFMQILRVLGEENEHKKLVIVTMVNLEIQCT